MDIFPHELLLFIFEINFIKKKFRKSLKYRNTLQVRKNVIRFVRHVPFVFISFYLFVFTFAMKLKDVNYKNH